jgi:UDP-N-acetylmuramate dehydrogenase
MKLLDIFGERIKQKELLRKHTTYRIGGPADFYLEVSSVPEIKEALNAAKDDGQKVYVMGGGSNLLVSDDGFRGLVLVPALRRMEIKDGSAYAEAGAFSALFARLASEAGLAGLEWSAGLPGTVGGAIRGNAGAYDASYGDNLASVDALDLRDGSVKKFNKDECGFSYRESIFKHQPYLILGASFSLAPGNRNELLAKMDETVKKRAAKYPQGVGSAGSVFKNHYFDSPEELSERVRARLSDKYLAAKKIPAGWLFETLDLKGKKIGGAMIALEHANFFVNTGGATASDVLQLISYAKMKVRDEFGIQLNEEIEYVGF